MRIAIVDESPTRAAVIRDGLTALGDCELFVVTERHGLVARIGELYDIERELKEGQADHATREEARAERTWKLVEGPTDAANGTAK